MNPWLLAGLVFSFIGLLNMAADGKQKPAKPAEKPKADDGKPAGVVVNSGGGPRKPKPKGAKPTGEGPGQEHTQTE